MSHLLLSVPLIAALALPSDSGVLLGLEDGYGLSGRPSTLWISSQGGRASLVRLKHLLLIPRREGFYWVSVDPERPVQPIPRPFTADSPSSADVRRRPTAPSADEHDDEDGCTASNSWRITFVNGRLLALSHWWGSECSYVSNSSEDVRVLGDRPGTSEPYGAPVSVTEALEAFDETELRQAAAAQLKVSEMGLDPEYVEIDPLSWSVQRGFGRWRPMGVYVTGGRHSMSVGFGLPASLRRDHVSDLPVMPGWDVILEVVPDAVDAFASPAGGLLVVLTQEAVLAYLPVNGRLGQPALRLARHNPNRSAVVMAEWATGRNVQRWDAIVRNAADRLRPKPFVPGRPGRDSQHRGSGARNVVRPKPSRSR